jgi:hypothetical protein
LKETIYQQKKSKESTISDSAKIEQDMPRMEQQLQELQEKKVQKEQEFEQLEMEVR